MSAGAGRRSPSVRTKERRRLLAALDAVADGAARVVEVSGEPGSGKSRLLGELTRQAARRGLPVVTGRCAPADRDLRFGVFHRLLSIRPAATTHDGDGSLPGALLAALLAGPEPDADPGDAGAGPAAALFDTALCCWTGSPGTAWSSSSTTCTGRTRRRSGSSSISSAGPWTPPCCSSWRTGRGRAPPSCSTPSPTARIWAPSNALPCRRCTWTRRPA
ncbi:AAA family ATPase [Frankia sp. AgKG'84/4]